MRVLLLLMLAAAAAAQQIPGIYIVELDGDPAIAIAAKAGLPRQAAADRRAVVQFEQARMRAALESRGVRVTGSTDTLLNTLTVEIADDRVAALRATPGVRRVYPAFEYRLELDHAPVLHRAVQAWEAVGGEQKAGEGVKIAIIDEGIDVNHPGFRGFEKALPEGFPKVTRESDLPFTNNKVIVAKSYGSSTSAQPVGSHGTAVAMAAAGVRNKGPFGTITGIAPGAFLGSYVIFSADGRAATSTILRAIEDAVVDGMDVINLSFGTAPAVNPDSDVILEAVERASAAGVIVTKSAGNEGPDPGTLTSPLAPSAITVGASWHGRTLAPAGAKVGDGPLYGALPGNGPPPPEPISGPIRDVAEVDPSGLACEPLPAGSLQGKVALIFRGVCFFEIKLNNAQAAGAIAALVYTDDREASRMDQVSAPLPGVMVANSDGLRIKKQIADTPELAATLYFDFIGVPMDPNEVVEFSSRGPAVNLAVKPDLVATGAEVYTAVLADDPNGVTGYNILYGTSFAAPIVAGAAAVVKAGRPGSTTGQVRSLVINSATRLVEEALGPSPVNSAGAGMLNVEAALKNTATANPTSLTFGSGGATVDASRDLKITNVSGTVQTYAAEAAPLTEGVVPDLSEALFTLEPGASKTLTLRLNQTGLANGTHQGFVSIRAVDAGTVARVPFFYAVRSSTPASITVVDTVGVQFLGAAPNSSVTLYVRINDAAQQSIDELDPQVSVTTGTGRVVSVDPVHGTFPGFSRVSLRLGALRGNNVFRIAAGEVVRTVSIRGN